MIGQEDLLKRVTATLEAAEIAYMVAGSIGSSLHGHPRATNDIDIVIAPTEEQLESFIESFGEEYYINTQDAKDAFDRKSMFNIIDNATGWKVDLLVRKERPFSIEEFQRRRTAGVMGVNVFVASPEDVILSKLEWAKASGSDQQVRDALGVIEVQADDLDLDYLKKWAAALNVQDSLEDLLKEGLKNGNAEIRGKG